MLYIFIKATEVQVLWVKKGMLGQSDFCFAKKSAPKKLITSGGYASVDVLASSLKDAIATLPKKINDNEATLVLAHQLYDLYRTPLPENVKSDEVVEFLKGKYRTARKQVDTSELHFDAVAKEHDGVTDGFLYAYEKSQLASLGKALELIDIKLDSLIPENLAYYTLFEKTVRFDKREHVLYVTYQDDALTGHMFDTYGPLHEYRPWHVADITNTNIEMTLHQKANEYLAKGTKLNRVIISGTQSEKIRQDTFTKNVGVWTNPLKRILPNFYQEYVATLTGKSEVAELFPFLSMDALFGAYVSSAESKAFPVVKHTQSKTDVSFRQSITNSPDSRSPMEHTTGKSFRIPKEVFLFLIIFAVTFAVFYLVANARSGSPVQFPSLAAKPTVTPTAEPTAVPPSPTPTVEVKREEVTIRVLNGSGITGKAAAIKSLLVDAGYVSVTTGNADNQDYTQSQLNINPDKAFLKESVLADIASSIESPTLGQLEASETADVVIIIGKDVQ